MCSNVDLCIIFVSYFFFFDFLIEKKIVLRNILPLYLTSVLNTTFNKERCHRNFCMDLIFYIIFLSAQRINWRFCRCLPPLPITFFISYIGRAESNTAAYTTLSPLHQASGLNIPRKLLMNYLCDSFLITYLIDAD